jgi:DNA-binding HxlR family transcriptional regulator
MVRVEDLPESTVQVRTLKWSTTQMVPKNPRRQVVDVQDILTSICTKWGLLILYELAKGRRRHGELRRTIGGVSQKMLTQTLRTLERDRLVRRTIYPVVPPRVDYALTPLGETLIQPLSALYRWMERHLKKIQQARRESQKTRQVVEQD